MPNFNQLTRIALLYIETGKQEQAIKLASQTLQVVNQIQDVYKKAVLLANIAVCVWKSRKERIGGFGVCSSDSGRSNPRK
jgi:hypothetical protein